MASQGRIRRHLFSEMQIGKRAIFDEEVVTNEGAIAAQHGPFSPQSRSYGSGDKPIPVEISTAVEISETRYTHGQAVGVRIALGNQVGAGLAHVVRVPALKWRAFGVWKDIMLSIGLVG